MDLRRNSNVSDLAKNRRPRRPGRELAGQMQKTQEMLDQVQSNKVMRLAQMNAGDMVVPAFLYNEDMRLAASPQAAMPNRRCAPLKPIFRKKALLAYGGRSRTSVRSSCGPVEKRPRLARPSCRRALR